MIPLFIRVLDESPHWLMSVGRKQEALDVLNKMARWNRVVAPNLQAEKFDLTKEDDENNESEEVPTRNENCCSIFRYKRVTIRFLIFSFGW